MIKKRQLFLYYIYSNEIYPGVYYVGTSYKLFEDFEVVLFCIYL